MSIALSRFIDAARWIAALTVAMFHVGALLAVFTPLIGSSPYQPPFVWLFWPSYAFAHEAVVVFFVLSGFLVGGAVLQHARTTRRWLGGYLLDRTVRIYIVLAPVLVVCGGLDLAGSRLFAEAGVYDSSFYTGAFKPWLVLTNLLNLQGTWFPAFGTNLPMWSLGMEYWYYISFALMALLLTPEGSPYRSRWRVPGAVAGLALAAALAASGSYFLFGFLIWIAGALIRVLPARAALVRSRAAALILFLAVSVAVRLWVNEAALLTMPVGYAVDLVEALLFANILLTLRLDESDGFAFTRSAIHERLSAFSYTLYACHLPVVVWLWSMCAVVFSGLWLKAVVSAAYYPIYLVMAGVVVAFSYGLSRLTEAHTARLRGALRTRLYGAWTKGAGEPLAGDPA